MSPGMECSRGSLGGSGGVESGPDGGATCAAELEEAYPACASRSCTLLTSSRGLNGFRM